DNIPGIPGVGEKTAAKLLNAHGSIEGIYENLDKVTGKKLLENLTTYKDDAFMSRDLATIDRQSPITITMDDAVFSGYDVKGVYALFQELEFKSLLNRFQEETPVAQEEKLSTFEFETIDTIDSELLGADS